MSSFWDTLPRPFSILAPMEDVTDLVFRQMVSRCARPHVFFTEFTSADGLLSKGKEAVARRLLFSKDESPIVAQLWGNNPETMRQAARLVADMGFDGIDINMGCPQRKFIQKGYCAGLIRTPSLAKEIYLAACEGAGDIPVSIKTRIGFNMIQTESWISFLLDLHPPALTVHGRTVKEKSLVPAHWDEIGKAVKIRNEKKSKTHMIGNGDVLSWQQGIGLAHEYGLDGIMIGSGVFHTISIFDPQSLDHPLSYKKKLDLLAQHIRLFQDTWGSKKPYMVMKKYFKIYVSGVEGAQDLRVRLMQTQTPEEALQILRVG